MERITLTPRADWQSKSEYLGFTWHTPNNKIYWNESAAWKFSPADVTLIQQATDDCNGMMLDTIESLIASRELPLFGYSPELIQIIEKSWAETEEPTMYGRFDFAFDGKDLKMLDYNGDYPTTFFEAGLVQAAWRQEVFPNNNQLNMIHDATVEIFRDMSNLLRGQLRVDGQSDFRNVYIAAMDAWNFETTGIAAYLKNAAAQAGLATTFIAFSDIGRAEEEFDDGVVVTFVDLQNQPITNLIHLEPLNWMLKGPFGPDLIEQVLDGRMRLIEPAWKILASNKRLMVEMWNHNAYHPNLLKTSTKVEPEFTAYGYVSKPVSSFNGQNITIYDKFGAIADQTTGDFGQDQMIYQEFANLAHVGDTYAVVNSWWMAGQSVGIGVREGMNLITDSEATFVPHIIE